MNCIFPQKYTFKDVKKFIKENKRHELIEAFKDRVEGFYLKPAKILNEYASKGDIGYSFSVILICSAVIDFLALFQYKKGKTKKRFIRWLEENISKFREDPELAPNFYNWFRCGVVHEGRIKSGCQISYELNELIKGKEEKKYTVINPSNFLKEIEDFFEDYTEKLRNDENEFECFKNLLHKKFTEEFKYIKRY